MSPPKATIVYIVTSGSYSDYGINCVFSDETLANEYVRQKNERETYSSDHYRVEEYELDPKSPSSFARTGKQWWSANIYSDDREPYAFPEYEEPKDKNDKLSDRGNFNTRVYCKHPEAAIKVAQERLMQHKARLEGMG